MFNDLKISDSVQGVKINIINGLKKDSILSDHISDLSQFYFMFSKTNSTHTVCFSERLSIWDIRCKTNGTYYHLIHLRLTALINVLTKWETKLCKNYGRKNYLSKNSLLIRSIFLRFLSHRKTLHYVKNYWLITFLKYVNLINGSFLKRLSFQTDMPCSFYLSQLLGSS